MLGQLPVNLQKNRQSQNAAVVAKLSGKLSRRQELGACEESVRGLVRPIDGSVDC
jgi:hypothetical protein